MAESDYILFQLADHWEEELVERHERRVPHARRWLRSGGDCIRARRSHGERRRHPRRDFHRRHGHELDLLDEQILCRSFRDFEEENEVGYLHLIEDVDEFDFYDSGLHRGPDALQTLERRYCLDVAEKDLEGSRRAEEAHWESYYLQGPSSEDEEFKLPPELDMEQRHRDRLEWLQGT